MSFHEIACNVVEGMTFSLPHIIPNPCFLFVSEVNYISVITIHFIDCTCVPASLSLIAIGIVSKVRIISISPLNFGMYIFGCIVMYWVL